MSLVDLEALKLFERSLDVADTERRRWVERQCGGNEDLAARVLELVAADEKTRHGLDDDLITNHAIGSGFARPERVGPWRVTGELGAGGMGSVYLAERVGDFEQRVAIKLLHPGLTDPQISERFAVERQVLAELDHPNIARLIDGGETDDGLPYVVMEYVDGQTIDQYVESRNLALPQVLDLMQTVCDAVQSAHASLVIHRDIKPSNILVSESGVVKLLDFGIAKVIGGHRPSPATGTGLQFMTPDYASPEQLMGSPLSTASDIYALGALLYRLLVGRSPHQLQDRAPAAVARVVMEETAIAPSIALGSARRLSWSGGQLKGDLDRIVMKALHRDPDRRYASARALADDLRRYLKGQPVEARPDGIGYLLGKFLSRHKVATTAVAALLAALIGAVFYSLSQAALADRQRDRAELAYARAQEVYGFITSMLGTANIEADGNDVTVLQALDRAASEVADQFDDPFVEAATRNALANIYSELAKPKEVNEQLQAALALVDPEEPDFASLEFEIHDLLTWNYFHQGDIDKVIEFGSRALELSADKPEFAFEFGDLVNVVTAAKAEAGDLEGARAVFRERLDQVEDGEARLQVLNLMGIVEMNANNLDVAQSILQEATSLADRLTGLRRLQATYPHYNLAVARSLVGRYDEAQVVFQRILSEHTGVLAEDSIDLANTRASFGFNYLLQGDAASALPLLRDAYAAYATQIPNEWRTHAARSALGLAMLDVGDEGATEHMENGLRALRAATPPHSPWRQRIEELASVARVPEAEPT